MNRWHQTVSPDPDREGFIGGPTVGSPGRPDADRSGPGQVEPRDATLRLVSNSPTANLVLETTGLRKYFTFADTVPDALNNVLVTGAATHLSAGHRPSSAHWDQAGLDG
ncbi:MAG: hypothetical protein DLM62_00355 [Pseudonocardiales bacterium]|nr:MAG: hypothetical protein DLM62_00355 [Pseudonocardiales bacterium]